MHQHDRCKKNDPTFNRPHASRPAPNQPGMQGSKPERRPTGWRHHGAPRALTPIATDTTKHRELPITQPTIQQQQITLNPPAPRESASLTKSGGMSKRHGMRFL